MKIFAVIVVVLIVAALVLADYKWRLWMTARRREHDEDHRA